MKQSTMQPSLFGIGELFSSHRPMATYIGDNEMITELRRTVGEKNETIIRQEKEIANTRAFLDETVKSNKILNAEVDLLREQVLHLKRIAQNKRGAPTTALPKDVWRRLLQLCHPDKHSNAESATLATQWLNANKPV